MTDQKTATKRAYDLAAERLCEHFAICAVCTPTGSVFCPIGQPLLEAENRAWHAYREGQP